MKNLLKKIRNLILYILSFFYKILSAFGLNLKNPVIVFFSIFIYFRDIIKYIIKYNKSKNPLVKKFPINFKSLVPMISDMHVSSGSAEGVYFIQDLWAAQKIYKKKPKEHLDIGSRVDGFISHLMVFMKVNVIDIRPLESNNKNLVFVKEDATFLKNISDNSVESLSCLHATEHFGLGRYSDEVNPESCFIFIKNLIRVLKPKGRLYFSVPVGDERLIFNAHRVFSHTTILNCFNELKLHELSGIKRDGLLYTNVDLKNFNDTEFKCGLFIFEK